MTSLRPLGLSAVDRARVEEVSLITGAGAAVDLVELLSEPSWAVRRAVVACLARMGSAIEPLCAVLLGDRRDETKFAAAVEALAGLMASADDNVAAAAAEALGRIGGAGIIGPLIVAVESGNFFSAFPAIAPFGAFRRSETSSPMSVTRPSDASWARCRERSAPGAVSSWALRSL